MKRRSSITKYKELSVRHFRVSETPQNQWHYHCADLMLDSYDSIGLVFVHLFHLMQSCIRSYDIYMLLSWKPKLYTDYFLFIFYKMSTFTIKLQWPQKCIWTLCCIRYKKIQVASAQKKNAGTSSPNRSHCDLPEVYTGILDEYS